MKTCPDCGVEPGNNHKVGCDIACCSRCGGQAISCGCLEEFIVEHAPDEISGAFHEEWPDLPWTGIWPGKSECQKYGWYAKFVSGKGWVECDKDDPEATENLNRLYIDARWNRESKRWLRKS
jgi:hypothetical protein